MPLPGRTEVRPTFWRRLRRERRLYWGLGLTALLTLLLASRVVPNRVTLQVGDTATENIAAPRSVTFVSALATDRAREIAERSVLRQYDNDAQALAESERIVRTIFGVIRNEALAPRGTDTARRVREAQEALPATVRLSPAALRTGLAASDATLDDLQDRVLQVVTQVMDTDIRSDNASVDLARREAAELAGGMHLPPSAVHLITEAAQCAIRPNRIFSARATEAARADARAAVKPVEVSITRDELLVRAGASVTEADVEKFTALGLQHPRPDLARVAGLFLFLAAVVLASSYFLRYYEPKVYHDMRRIALLSILVCVGAAGLKIGYSFLGVPLTPSQLGYLSALWVTVPAMLAASLVSVNTALLISAMLAVTAGVAWEMEPRYLAMALVSALVGIYGISRIRDRSDLTRMASWIAASNVSLVWILGLLNGSPLDEMRMGTVWATGVGVVAPLLFWLLTAVLERPFGLVTHIGLLELSDMNRELLRRLQWEAPGTYHHSLGVAVLAEGAAEAIGADPLLARVASYYHDIGKLRRPHYFVENQLDGNVHDTLAPTLSTIAITSHVKDGLDLAKHYHLPPVILDAIVQHHGTSLVSFFYHQATAGEGKGQTLEQQFRYEGPKPQTREMAILMLADSVEAVARTLEKPTPQKIEQTIEAIIEAKLKDGQFDECDLTFRDLRAIRASFVRNVVSMLHARIEYPGAIVPEPPPALPSGAPRGAPRQTPGAASA